MKNESVVFSLEQIDDEPGMFGVVRQEQIVAQRCTFGVDSDGLITVVALDGTPVVDDLGVYDHVWGADLTPLMNLDVAAPAAAAPAAKYRTVPEDGLLRIYALRDIPGRAMAGDRGGLIGHPDNLEQSGACWIDSSSKVTGSAKVREDALVLGGSVVTGGVLERRARVYNCEISSGWVITDQAHAHSCRLQSRTGGGVIWHRARLHDTTISVDRGRVDIGGDADLTDCTITGPVDLMGIRLENASLRGMGDFLSIHTRFGVLSAYRGTEPGIRNPETVQRFAVGCQRVNGFKDLRRVARAHDATQMEEDLLEKFFEMVKLCRARWDLTVEPLGDDDRG